MKKITFFALAALAVAGCSRETDLYEGPQQPSAEEHAKQLLGTSFDVNQSYDMLKSGSVEIAADVESYVGFKSGKFEVAKIQILSGNPFYESDVVVLNEASASQGETKTLYFDAPADQEVLYAAVVSKDNRYRVKAFNIGDSKVSFIANPTKARATTRANFNEASTGTEVETPTCKFRRMSNNYGARTDTKWAGNVYWKDSYWNDRLYDMTATVEALEDFTTEERAEVNGIIDVFTPETVDSRNSIKQSEFYIETSNYFTATQEAKPIKVTFIHSGASVIDKEHLYYYYYNPADVAGMDDEQRTEYLEQLPKYCLINCKDTHSSGHWQFTKRAFRYTLAYFGDEKAPADGTQGTYAFPAGYKIGFMLWTEYPNAVELYSDPLLNNEINFYGAWAEAQMGKNMSRAAIYGANGKNYVGFEDWKDNDFNDVVFQVEGGIEIIDEEQFLDKGVYTYAFEDTENGDYDMNDVVIKAQRQNATQVKFSLEATGAYDELYIKTSDSKLQLATLGSKEVHQLFGLGSTKQFVNTVEAEQHVQAVQELVTVPANFSFGGLGKAIYIENKTKGKTVRLAEKGQDPHGILIPYDWQYPQEYICVNTVFSRFNSWGANRIDATDWFKYPGSKAYTKSKFE